MSVSTKYEITATKDGQQTYLIAYAARLSMAGLNEAISHRADAVLTKLEIKHNYLTFASKPRPHATIDGWIIGFTGRTLRDAKHSQSFQHPYIAA